MKKALLFMIFSLLFTGWYVFPQGNAENNTLMMTHQNSNLSQNDENQLRVFRERLPQKTLKQVDAFMKEYEKRLQKLPLTQRENIKVKAINLFGKKTFELIMKYPQDIALPPKVNREYMVLEVLKLEIMKR